MYDPANPWFYHFWSMALVGLFFVVAVILFDIYRALAGGPGWLNQLDLLAAATYTVIIGGVDT